MNLRTQVTYNPYLQRASRTMPAQVAATGPMTMSEYYGPNDTLATATCGIPAGTRQNGFLKKMTSPAGANTVAVVTEFVYDNLGRTVGTLRTGDAAWTCTVFDGRWRPVSVAFPADADTPARTVSSKYTETGAAGANPLITSVADAAGTIATESDLLGRTTKYTDVWGTITIPTYDLDRVIWDGFRSLRAGER